MGVHERELVVMQQQLAAMVGTDMRDFNLFAAVLTAGTAIADFSNGASATPGYENVETTGIRWNDNATHTPIKMGVTLPRNFDGSRPATLYIWAAKTGATAAISPTFTVTAFTTKPGDLYDADADFGGVTAALTDVATAKTIQQVSLTLAAADLPDDGPATLNITIQPTDGTLATNDDLILNRVFVEFYTKPV